MTVDEMILAAFAKRTPNREAWLKAWVDFLASAEPYTFKYASGDEGVFKPTALTAGLLARIFEHIDSDGFAVVSMSRLAHELNVRDGYSLAAHLRALGRFGIVERYTRPGACNRYRLALERMP